MIKTQNVTQDWNLNKGYKVWKLRKIKQKQQQNNQQNLFYQHLCYIKQTFNWANFKNVYLKACFKIIVYYNYGRSCFFTYDKVDVMQYIWHNLIEATDFTLLHIMSDWL